MAVSPAQPSTVFKPDKFVGAYLMDPSTGGSVSPLGGADLITVTLSLDTSAYSDGDVLATTQEVANAFRAAGGRAILQSLHVIDLDDQGVAFDVLFLSANSSLGTENSAPDIDDTEVLDVLGMVRVGAGDYIDLGANRIATLTGLGLVLEAASDSTSLWIAAITRGGTPTYTASGIRLKLGLLPVA